MERTEEWMQESSWDTWKEKVPWKRLHCFGLSRTSARGRKQPPRPWKGRRQAIPQQCWRRNCWGEGGKPRPAASGPKQTDSNKVPWGTLMLPAHLEQPLKTQTSASSDWTYICWRRNCQQPSLLSHTTAKWSHAFTWPNQRHPSMCGWDTAGLLTDATQYLHAFCFVLLSESCLVKPHLSQETADREQRKWWEGGDLREASQMKPSALWKDFREEELFYPLLINQPSNAAPLQYGQAWVRETELPNAAAFLTRQHPFPSALPKAFPGTWWHRSPQGNTEACSSFAAEIIYALLI